MSICGDAPDTSGMNAAAVANAEIAKEALAWYKQQYIDQAPMRDKAADLITNVANAQVDAMNQNTAISKDYWDYQQGTFRPLEKGIVTDAQNYDTQGRRDSEAASAMAGVQQQMDATIQQQSRDLARQGVNPNSGKMLSMRTALDINGALGKAAAANKAIKDVELQGYARKMDAANLGRNLASNQATSAKVAIDAGNSASGNAVAPVNMAQSATNMVGQGFNTAVSANNSAGNIFGNMAQIQGQDSGAMGALGSVVGQFAGSKAGSTAIAGFLSDKKAKKNIKPTSGKKALESIEKTKVSDWQYKDGQGDGAHHTGPMAQDVQANMGDHVAPGGKLIDPITMNGITMASVAELSRRVKELESKQGAKA
jgi:hypothetical protein